MSGRLTSIALTGCAWARGRRPRTSRPLGAAGSSPGVRYPWTSVAPVLRCADVAFRNLECAVSTRGALVPKEFSFRGRPAALRAMGRYAGLDVLNLANNHVGD